MTKVDSRVYDEKLKEYRFHSKQHNKAAKKMLRAARSQSLVVDLVLRDVSKVLNYHLEKMDELEEWLNTHSPDIF